MYIHVRREWVDAAAPLFAVSSNSTFVKVVNLKGGALPRQRLVKVRLHGVKGGHPPNLAELEIRHGSTKGPVVARLATHCFTPLSVVVTPHLVTIAQVGGAVPPQKTVTDIDRLIAQVRAIWQPCGVDITLSTAQPDTVQFAQAGVVSDAPFPGELATLLAQAWVPNTINVYLVPQIGNQSVLGYGFSRQQYLPFGLPNPGIVLADRTADGTVHDLPWAANDLAHEIGHFLKLPHVDFQNDTPGANDHVLMDTWSRRMLMHNYNRTSAPLGTENWRNDTGYGAGRRGALVSLKDLPTNSSDPECTTARGAIVAGPY